MNNKCDYCLGTGKVFADPTEIAGDRDFIRCPQCGGSGDMNNVLPVEESNPAPTLEAPRTDSGSQRPSGKAGDPTPNIACLFTVAELQIMLGLFDEVERPQSSPSYVSRRPWRSSDYERCKEKVKMFLIPTI